MVSEATRQSYRDFLKQQREMCDSASEIIFTHFGVSPTSILGGSLLYNLDAGITIQTYCNDHKKWISLSYYSGIGICHSEGFDNPVDSFEKCILITREKVSAMLNTLPQRKEGQNV